MFLHLCIILFTGEGSPWQRPPGQRPPPMNRDPPRQRPPCTVKSGWYASYWNAFLLLERLRSYVKYINLFSIRIQLLDVELRSAVWVSALGVQEISFPKTLRNILPIMMIPILKKEIYQLTIAQTFYKDRKLWVKHKQNSKKNKIITLTNRPRS